MNDAHAYADTCKNGVSLCLSCGGHPPYLGDDCQTPDCECDENRPGAPLSPPEVADPSPTAPERSEGFLVGLFDPAPDRLWLQVTDSDGRRINGMQDFTWEAEKVQDEDVEYYRVPLPRPASEHWSATEEAQARYLVATMTGRTVEDVTEPLSRLLHELRYGSRTPDVGDTIYCGEFRDGTFRPAPDTSALRGFGPHFP